MWRLVISLSRLLSSSSKSNNVIISNKALLCAFNTWDSQHHSLATQASSSAPVKNGKSISERHPFITFVLGGPGSGKGTQCLRIAEAFGFTHLSAGELLRREIMANSEDGALIVNWIKEGNIVPSEVTVKLLQREMESDENYRFLIDGFPRCEENRVAFERIVGCEPNMVLFFDCPEEEMIKRVLNRNQGRVDDNLDIVKKRLEVFRALSIPVVDYYSKKGKLRMINGMGTEDEIFKRVRPVFEACEEIKQSN